MSDKMNEEQVLPINKIVKGFSDFHVQWVTVISVAVLIATYANSFSSLEVIKDGRHNPVFQYFNIILLTADLLLILNFFKNLIFEKIPTIMDIKSGFENGEINYTNTLTSFKDMEIKIYSSWRTPLRILSYVCYVFFWFGVKNSYQMSFGFSMSDLQKDNCLGLGVMFWAVMALLFFVALIEMPIMFIYFEIKKIVNVTKVTEDADMQYL